MDDILSAVDAHTAQSIATECLQGDLVKGRTVVLVTHHVTLCLPAAHYVVALQNGAVEQACFAADLRTGDVETTFKRSENAQARSQHDKQSEGITETRIIRKIHKEEHRAKGRVAISHYRLLFDAVGGRWYWFVFFALLFAARATFMSGSFVLEAWSSDHHPDHLNRYLLLYGLAVFSGALFGGLHWVWLYGVGKIGFLNSGTRKIHAMLVDSLAGATLGFFERTPTGRLINIFGSDMARIDTEVSDDVGREWCS